MKVKLFVTTDIHGNIFPTNYTSRDNVEDYGLARISTAIQTYREQGEIILLDNGDSFQGTPLTTFAHEHPNEYMNPIAQAFNTLDYDYINLGNHDFNYGRPILEKFIKETKAPLLTSNLTIDGKAPGQTQIIEKDGKKIALIGLLTQYIPKWERPNHIEGMEFFSAYDHLESEVKRLRNDVDYIIAMYHGGLERDPDTGTPTERLTGENEGYQLTDIEGLDILITGHQHRTFVKRVNGVLVTQSTFKGQEFVTIDLDLENGESNAKIHEVAKYPVDESFLVPYQEIEQRVQTWLDQKIGTLKDGPVTIADELDARINKHPIVSLLNQIQLDRSGADISSVALFNNASGFNQEITMRDLVSTYIYPNTLVVKSMTGKAIKEMLEFNAIYFVVDGNKIVPNPAYVEPKPQHYNYDMLDGIDYTINVGNPIGERISDVFFNGKPLNDNDHYKMVVNNYRAMGGGNFHMVAESETVQEIQEEMVDTIANYFKKNPEVVINHKNNITVKI
ncbi:bifunctional UDP-sugar hydrolase/5'-nucleotidase [Erysipelothrix urinaevulpis]|uniref:bifunctional metallophosphatase/5'-nucleotidase n=1 Tax=Erysipelothrix urinaevulpis TaxID=2683717 RepID=UPI001358595F|nr:bifunctional UDP-sugar hydrolase/5'-nucleotidase [Erysipelothrix urinaevulpis]